MEALSFAECYYEKRKQPHPSVAFITEIANITHRSPIAVRKWVTGENNPDLNCQNIIANHLGIPREVLFPSQQEDNN